MPYFYCIPGVERLHSFFPAIYVTTDRDTRLNSQMSKPFSVSRKRLQPAANRAGRVTALLCTALSAAVFLNAAAPLQAADMHAEYTALLRDHVKDGVVNYVAIAEDPRLERYLAQLAATNPEKLGEAEQIAYWLNVYNAFTLKVISDNLPLESISELHMWGSLYIGVILGETVWEDWEFPLYNGKTYTLDQVEHAILRPVYQDYRHHAAMVCAARSCPPLRSEAYEGDRIDAQLDDQMRAWLANPFWNRYDEANQQLLLSSIFNWFEDDFIRDGRALFDVLLPYWPQHVRAALIRDRATLRSKYLTYDWSLNDRPARQAEHGSPGWSQ